MAKAQDTRLRIIENAARIFYQHGYHATGVDEIAKSAGITKATLYHYFHNKEDLIEAALKYMTEQTRNEYVRSWNKNGLTDKLRLTTLFDDIHTFLHTEDAYGCPFINAAGEFTDRSSFVRRICESNYQFIVSHLEQFARDAGLIKPRIIANHLASLIYGAYCAWYVGGIDDGAKSAKKAAELIIEAHSQR